MIGKVENRSDQVIENIFETRPPAVPPEMLERGNEV